MATKIQDLRCTGCGKKLAEAVNVTQGEIRVMCPRCKTIVTIKAG